MLEEWHQIGLEGETSEHLWAGWTGPLAAGPRRKAPERVCVGLNVKSRWRFVVSVQA